MRILQYICGKSLVSSSCLICNYSCLLSFYRYYQCLAMGSLPPVWSGLILAAPNSVICVNNTTPGTGGKLIADPCKCRNGGACYKSGSTYTCDCSMTGMCLIFTLRKDCLQVSNIIFSISLSFFRLGMAYPIGGFTGADCGIPPKVQGCSTKDPIAKGLTMSFIPIGTVVCPNINNLYEYVTMIRCILFQILN